MKTDTEPHVPSVDLLVRVVIYLVILIVIGMSFSYSLNMLNVMFELDARVMPDSVKTVGTAPSRTISAPCPPQIRRSRLCPENGGRNRLWANHSRAASEPDAFLIRRRKREAPGETSVTSLYARNSLKPQCRTDNRDEDHLKRASTRPGVRWESGDGQDLERRVIRCRGREH